MLPGLTEAQGVKGLERIWGLSPLNSEFRHRLEGIKIKEMPRSKRERMEVATWYEDLTVTEASPPDQRLFCRFMHSFVFGRAVVRNKAGALPPTIAFDRFRNLGSIRFSYIAVIYNNKPSSPFWDKRPTAPRIQQGPEGSKLRVVWDREEKVIPYLSIDVNRNEWRKAAKYLAGRPYYNFDSFPDKVCGTLFKIMPRVRSNFAGLEDEILGATN